MVSQKLKEWIKTEEAAGYTEDQLRKYLFKQGYDHIDVEETIKAVQRENAPVKTRLVPIAIIAVIVLLIGGGVFMFMGESDLSDIQERVEAEVVEPEELFVPELTGFRIINSKLCTEVTDDLECVEKENNVYKRGETVYVWFLITEPGYELIGSNYIYTLFSNTSAVVNGEELSHFSSVSEEINEAVKEPYTLMRIYRAFSTDEEDPLGNYKFRISLNDINNDEEVAVEMSVILE